MHLIVQQGSEDGVPQVEVWTACIARLSLARALPTLWAVWGCAMGSSSVWHIWADWEVFLEIAVVVY